MTKNVTTNILKEKRMSVVSPSLLPDVQASMAEDIRTSGCRGDCRLMLFHPSGEAIAERIRKNCGCATG
jgi:hypothetical protein